MPEQDLDHPNVNLLLKQMGRKTMTQRVHGDAFVDVCGQCGGGDGAVELSGGHRIGRVETGEEPATGQDLALRMPHAPPTAQALQQHGREHRIAILAALALFHPQRHALAVDVADLDRDDLADAKAGAIGQRQSHLMLQVSSAQQQARHLRATEHDGQPLRHPHRLHLGHQLTAVQRDVKEESQAGDGGVEGDGRCAVIDQVQLESPQILDACGAGRAFEEVSELADGADIAGLRLGRHLAHAHVVEHALTQPRNGGLGLAHGDAPVERRGGVPQLST